MQQVAMDPRLQGESCCPQMPVWPLQTGPTLSQPGGGPVTKKGPGRGGDFQSFTLG